MEQIEHEINELDPTKEYVMFIDRHYVADVAMIKLANKTRVWIIATLDGKILDKDKALKLIQESE